MPFTARRSTANGATVALALAIAYAASGTTFVILKLVSHHIPPVQLTATRLLGAGTVLAPFAVRRVRQMSSRPSWNEVRAAAVTGLLLLTIGQTGLIWGVATMPIGVAAVIGSSAPLFIALFTLLTPHGSLPRRQLAGVLFGLVGIAALAWSAPQGEISLIGITALLVSAAAWAAGSLHGRSGGGSSDPLVSITLQLLIGGAAVLPLAIAEGVVSGQRIDPTGLSVQALGGIAVLIAVAIAAFGSFTWLNRNTSSTVANTFSYVAPILALILGAVLFGESLGVLKLTAAAMALIGVAMMIR
ncbi:DMT family transporter [Methylobacterium sp. E-045]|uniref:DMT family transporter n=1 Tax=Methylobacterium sp. E-045 TaxID=2836575 RepID=UPI001FB92E9F|nr:EamA family transporter [Methylobacterium sp. E-045]MCJ2130675.1 EamA family transporter [Methylobacterium sp. E-045]